jgi:serine protease
MNKKVFILATVFASSLAQGQPFEEASAAEGGTQSRDAFHLARTTQLIVKLKAGPAVATTMQQPSASPESAADIEAVIARVQRKRRHDRSLLAFGAAAGSAPGADADPGAEVRVKRVMTQGQHVLRMAHPMSVKEAAAFAAEFAADPAVAYAEPDFLAFAQRMPVSDRYFQQWGFHDGPGGARFEKAWDRTTGSDREIVAVVDNGVRPHRDLVARLLPGYDFISDRNRANHARGRNPDATDPGDWLTLAEVSNPASPFYQCSTDPLGNPTAQDSSWHGTHVAGTIGSVSYHAKGGAGGTWQGSLLPVRVLGKCGGTVSDIVDGMRWAAGLHVKGVPDNPHPATVINMSLGAFAPFGCPNVVSEAIDQITARGATIVVAAGNVGRDARLFMPGSCKGVVTVAAHDRHGQKAWFTNTGPAVLLSAPGVDIWSTSDAGRQKPRIDFYGSKNGTSMAAPHVSAAVALMRSVNGALTPAEVKTLLVRSARPFPADSRCVDQQCGVGMLDAEAAVRAAEQARVGT